MPQKKEYRNAIRSRRLIRAAFLEMMHEKPFEKITATDIIIRSGLNRSTFYAHYPDVKGILDEIIGEIQTMFQQVLDELDFAMFIEDPQPILDRTQAFLTENRELYHWLCKSNMASAKLEEIKQLMIRQALNSQSVPNRGLQTEIQTRLMLGGVIDVFQQWLTGELCCTQEELKHELTCAIKQWKPVWMSITDQ